MTADSESGTWITQIEQAVDVSTSFIYVVAPLTAFFSHGFPAFQIIFAFPKTVYNCKCPCLRRARIQERGVTAACM